MKVAVIQHPPKYLNLTKSMDLAVELIKTAAKKLSTTSERTIIKEKIIASSLLNIFLKTLFICSNMGLLYIRLAEK